MQTRARDWLRTGASAIGDWDRTKALVRDTAFRLERKYAKRFSDVQLRQLRGLEHAWSRDPGRDLLVFGDSAMFWTTPTDADHRHLAEMLRDELSPETTFEALVGPGYNARIVMAFLAGLERCRSRPKVVIVPASVLMSQTNWLAHPEVGYRLMSEEIKEIVASARRRRPRRLVQHDTDEAIAEWERLPAPSLYGARVTVGELRLITNAAPATRWQRVIRLRHLMDFYNAERLESDSIGIRLVAEMGATLKALGVPSVAYIPPVNHEVLAGALGKGAREHVERNATLIEEAFQSTCGEHGAVVNAIWDSPATEYVDPVHLTPEGRLRFARRLAEAAAPHLGDRGAP
ncbi:MAG: hypothetical protein ACYDHH_15630 [Solirubrobacteraceae bacterium]